MSSADMQEDNDFEVVRVIGASVVAGGALASSADQASNERKFNRLSAHSKHRRPGSQEMYGVVGPSDANSERMPGSVGSV